MSHRSGSQLKLARRVHRADLLQEPVGAAGRLTPGQEAVAVLRQACAAHERFHTLHISLSQLKLAWRLPGWSTRATLGQLAASNFAGKPLHAVLHPSLQQH